MAVHTQGLQRAAGTRTGNAEVELGETHDSHADRPTCTCGMELRVSRVRAGLVSGICSQCRNGVRVRLAGIAWQLRGWLSLRAGAASRAATPLRDAGVQYEHIVTQDTREHKPIRAAAHPCSFERLSERQAMHAQMRVEKRSFPVWRVVGECPRRCRSGTSSGRHSVMRTLRDHTGCEA